MSSDRKLKLEVVLQAIDRVTAPIRTADASSRKLAEGLGKTRDALKTLEAAERNVRGYRTARAELHLQSKALAEAQEKAKTYTARLEAQRNTHDNLKGNLKAARHEYDRLASALKNNTGQSQEFSREFELAKIRLLSMQQATERSLGTINRYKAAVKNAEQSTTQLNASHANATQRLNSYKEKLEAAGVPMERLGAHARTLRGENEKLNKTLTEQKGKLAELGAETRKYQQLQAKYDERMARAGKYAVGGAATLGAAYAMSRPANAAAAAFATQEDAAIALRNTMTGANNQVAAEYERINALAQQLGNRLPGSTADFADMMTTLRRQGIASQDILTGVGEGAAYLAVQLKLSSAEGAQFAAKMQDATRTPARDMMALMDQIQRAYNLGVDPTNMLQGITKVSPAMGILKKEGLDAMKALMPLLVMMDQTGMAGESAGNAIRKVMQASVDADKRDKVNKALRGTGVQFDFSNGKGNFGGLDKLFTELAKLNKLNDEQRKKAINTIFGDDSETLQVVELLMTRGAAGYAEVTTKLQQQASLRDRVNNQLSSLSNITDAAKGNWDNAMAAWGEAIAPGLKDIITWLGEAAAGLGNFAKEHPKLAAAVGYTSLALAVLLAVAGGLMVALAGVLGPLAIMRFGFAMLGVQGPGVVATLAKVASGFSKLGLALVANPIGLAIALIVATIWFLWANWDKVVALWDASVELFAAVFNGNIDTMIVKLQSFLKAARELFSFKVFGVETSPIAYLLKGAEFLTRNANAAAPGNAPPIDTRAPLPAGAAAGRPVVVQAGPSTITLHAAPGMNEAALARAVAAELNRRDRELAARGRSALRDTN